MTYSAIYDKYFSGIVRSGPAAWIIVNGLIALIIYTLTRLGLLIWIWPQLAADLVDLFYVFIVGAVYDISFLIYLIIPACLYIVLVPRDAWQSRIHQAMLALLNFSFYGFLVFILIAEFLFWNEFKVRFNFISVDYLVYRREVTNNIFESYPMLPIISAIVAAAIVLTVWVTKNWGNRFAQPLRLSQRLSLLGGAVFLSCINALTLGQSLHQLTDNTYLNELASNGPYQFFASFRNNELDYRQFYISIDKREVDKEIKQELATDNAQYETDQLMDIRRYVDNSGAPRRMNIVMIMVESLSDKFIGYFGDKKGLTPNLNQLTSEALFFDNFYATGTRTTRGLEAVTLSIPPTPGRSIVKRIGREKNMWSLGNVLKSKGYDTKFIYGGRGYFDNMNEFFSGNGYSIIDQSSMPDDEIGFENAWGVADEYLFAQALKAADMASKKEKPFFFHIMTTSNHRPYTYPEGRIDIPSGTGRDGAVKYTDWAIGKFIDQAKQREWFNNTLFVILADHQAGVAGKSALPVERYRIPMWIYSPANIEPGVVHKLSSQIDVAPTLLAMLNFDYESAFYGKNILTMKPQQERALIGNYQHIGVYKNNRLAFLSPQQQAHIKTYAADGEETISWGSTEDPLVRLTIDYYQSAAYVYRNKLNQWQPLYAEHRLAASGR